MNQKEGMPLLKKKDGAIALQTIRSGSCGRIGCAIQNLLSRSGSSHDRHVQLILPMALCLVKTMQTREEKRRASNIENKGEQCIL